MENQTPDSPFKTKAGKDLATASLILGILSIIGVFLPCLGIFSIIFGILAIVLGRMGLKKAQLGNGDTNMAKAGFILGIVGTAVNAVWWLVVAGMITSSVLQR